MKLATIPVNCPAPERPHLPDCDALAHHQLITAVDRLIDPPIFRAAVGNHELCALEPCADCR